ncbi:helix-turn-helix transcriptional regulator [Fodinicurvata halophila]|uniref:Helix-turn-helix transcriptional regulator n=1 Tax=Fodinicurvata halophila TaxID=1419723 RepID=A0ABV8UJ29_9PROT
MAKQNQKVLVACDPEALFRSQGGLQAKKTVGLLLREERLKALSLSEDLHARLEHGEIVRLDFSKLHPLQVQDTTGQRTVVPFILMTTLEDVRQMLMTFRYWGWEVFSFGVFFFDAPRHSEQDRLVLAEFGFCVMSRHAMAHFLRCPGAIQFPKDLDDEDRRLLDCLGHGMTNAQIARELKLPLARVKTLVRALLARLNLENRTCAAVLAYWMREAEEERAMTPESHNWDAVAGSHRNRKDVQCHEKGVGAVLEG